MAADAKQIIEAAATAYGYLWLMPIDKLTKDGFLKSEARKALVGVLSVEDRLAGVNRAMASLAVAPTQEKEPGHDS